MKLTVVIVNYNVKHFIRQCLYSVREALELISGEVIVVDNNSVDGSCQMIREEFPEVALIENKKNTGFSVANNQAIRMAQGEYILLLNPDTVVQRDTLFKCAEFMDQHPEAGALGVKMIDGKGNFLPESKRSLPTPLIAFFKMFGLSRLFPRSGFFNRYNCGHLSENEIHEIEILAGAFMFMRKTALDKTGLLDETFFMYGEDIDLSYRLIQSGYKNYYFPETPIIHYKGESTKKGSINYVVLFYNAMIIFAHKHFSKSNAFYFSLLIRLAIYFRAFMALIQRFIVAIAVPLADAAIIYSGFLLIRPYWEKFKPDGGNYPEVFIKWIIPAYVLIWVLSLLFNGAYDPPVKMKRTIRGLLIGTLIILSIYALLPLEFRFSRALILLGTIWSLLFILLFRYFLHLAKLSNYRIGDIKKRIVIIGEVGECDRVADILRQTHIRPEIVGFVSPNEVYNGDYIGHLEQIDDIIRVYQVEEIVFCARNIDSGTIIRNMLELSNAQLEYKIAPPESLSVIGSNSIDTAGDLYLINLNSINKRSNIRKKRILDFLVSIGLIIIWPLMFWLLHRPFNAIYNAVRVLTGQLTWVGYEEFVENNKLPKIKKGILTPLDGYRKVKLDESVLRNLNHLYSKDYKVLNDILILFKSFKELGR